MQFISYLIFLGCTQFFHPVKSFKFLDGLPLPIAGLDLDLLPDNTDEDGYQYQSYQRSITCTADSKPMEPTSLPEIQDIILHALQTGNTVKAIGNLHSVTDCFCTEHIVLNMSRINHFSYDSTTGRATVGAGMTLMELMEHLHENGRALQSAPSYSNITVGGAIGTGAIGSSLIHPSTLSDQIFSVTFVDGEGNVRQLNATEEDFKAFRVHLGLLGVIYEVEVDTIEQYKLHMLHFPVSDEILWNGTDLLDFAEEFDVFQFFWFPMNKEVVLSVGRRVPVEEPGTCESHQISEFPKVYSNAFSLAIELMQKTRDNIGFFLIQSYAKLSLYRAVPGRQPYFMEADGVTPCVPEAVGFSHRIMTSGCKECFWKQGELSMLEDDSNIAVPLTKLYPALHTLKEIMDKELVLFPLNGIYFRFIKASDAYTAMSNGKDAVNIEWITNPRYDKTQAKLGITAYQAIGQALVRKHGGRPHWGKNGLMFQNPEILYRVHPQLDKFVEAIEKYDPLGVFMNDFGRRIRYKKNQMTVTSEMSKRCALTEVCKCEVGSDNKECGDGSPLAYECMNFLGNQVCKQSELLENLIGNLKVSLERQAINKLANVVNNNEDFLFDLLGSYKSLENIFATRRKKGAVKE